MNDPMNPDCFEVALETTNDVHGSVSETVQKCPIADTVHADEVVPDCPCCSKYEELNEWADSLEEVANNIENDDDYYAEAKADIIENSWGSQFAAISMWGYRDRNVPSQTEAALMQHFDGKTPDEIFFEDLSPALQDDERVRPEMAKAIRERASIARKTASEGLEYCENNKDYQGDGANPVLDYLCTGDPKNITRETWNRLGQMGFIDYATWSDVNYKILADRWAKAELAASVISLPFAFGAALGRLAKGSVKGALRFTKGQAQRLAGVVKGKLPASFRKKYTRVGRWMHKEEYDLMLRSGRVQEGAGGATSVANGGAGSFKSQAGKGSYYVEFDVPTSSLLKGGREDWFKIIGPNANKASKRALERRGGELLPKFKDIKVLEVKK